MSQSNRPGARLVRPLSAIPFALAVALVAPLAAQAAPAAPVELPAQRVTIDPATGRVRHMEHDELARERSQAARPDGSEIARKLGPARTVQGRAGSYAMKLDASHLSFSVVTRGADGKLEQTCVEGLDAAKQVVNATAGEAANVR